MAPSGLPRVRAVADAVAGLPSEEGHNRVRRCLPGQFAEDRFSFAVFANPPATGSLYQIDRNGRPDPLIGVAEFLHEFNRQTWNDSYDDFGIAASPHGAPADRS